MQLVSTYLIYEWVTSHIRMNHVTHIHTILTYTHTWCWHTGALATLRSHLHPDIHADTQERWQRCDHTYTQTYMLTHRSTGNAEITLTPRRATSLNHEHLSSSAQHSRRYRHHCKSQKSPVISGSFAERNLQPHTFYASWPLCIDIDMFRVARKRAL